MPAVADLTAEIEAILEEVNRVEEEQTKCEGLFLQVLAGFRGQHKGYKASIS